MSPRVAVAVVTTGLGGLVVAAWTLAGLGPSTGRDLALWLVGGLLGWCCSGIVLGLAVLDTEGRD